MMQSPSYQRPCNSTLWVGYGNTIVYVLVLAPSNNAQGQERNINYASERVHIFPYLTNNLSLHTRYYHKKLNNRYYIISSTKSETITSLLNKQKLQFKTKVTLFLPLLFLWLLRNMEVYSMEFYS